MAASRETPGELRSRREQEAAPASAGGTELWVPPSAQRTAVAVVEPEPEIEEPIQPQVYGRRPAKGERRAMVASATRIDLTDRKAIQALRYRRQSWQSEAHDYVDEVPEIGNVIDYESNLLSKLRLFSAVRPEPAGPPIPVDSEESGVDPTEAKIAMETLARLRSIQGGQNVIVGDITYNFTVCGECFLHGHEDTETREEDWQIRSVDELVVTGDRFGLRIGTASTTVQPLPAEDVVIRLWQRHRRFASLSTSPMRRVLSIAENLLLLDRELRSTSQSRLPNGLLVFPQEMSFGPADPTRDQGDGEADEDPFLADFNTAVNTAIQEPGAASAAAPIAIQGPSEHIDKIRFIKFSRELDATLDTRIDNQVMRLARGMSMPVEVVRGLAESTFANASQARRSEWDSYGEPKATLIVDVLTTGYYQWMLEEAGIAHERAREHFIWFDPAACIAAPDAVEAADKGLEEGNISAETWRRVKGFAESDAPNDDELLLRILLKATRLDPFVIAQLFKITGLAPDIEIPAPSSGILGETQEPPVQAALMAALTDKRGARLGRRLLDIDRDLRTRLHTAAEAAMRRALERAGNRVKSRLGRPKNGNAPMAAAAATARELIAEVAPGAVTAALGPKMLTALGLSGDDLLDESFDDLGPDFQRMTAKAQKAALAALAAEGITLDDATLTGITQQQDAHRDAAWDVLLTGLVALAGQRLFDPTPGATQGESDDSTVPVGLLREALAVAGGDNPQGGAGGSLRSMDGSPVGGVATGPDVLSATDGVEGWQWDYGSAPRNPLESHLALDGETFESFDDPILANDDSFPEVDYLAPGDHSGCFPAGTLVSGPPVRGATLRHHQGEIVTVRFASGKFLTATPNHPVLTDHGWKPIGELDQGTRVVRCGGTDGVAGLVPNDEQVPARIEDVATAFGVRTGVVARGVEVSPMDFHGDGAGSEVAVVWTDGDLRDGGDTAIIQPDTQASFAGTHPTLGVGLSSQGSSTELFDGVGNPTFGFMGSLRPSHALLGGAGSMDNDHGVLESTAFDAPLLEPIADGAPVHSISSAKRVLGLAAEIGSDDLIARQRRELGLLGSGHVSSPQGVASSDITPNAEELEVFAKALGLDMELEGDIIASLPSEVSLDSVTEIVFRRFAGHVFNLQTDGHWYLAGGVIVHNCTCDLIPILVMPDGSESIDTGAGTDGGDGE